MFNINTNQGYFLHLMKCALKDECPLERPEGVSLETLYDIAYRQGLLNLIWFSIEKLNNNPSDALCQKWRISSAQLLRQMAYQEMELELLIQTFSELGYKMLVLKGYQIKNYYPKPDMRTMGDIDLLIQNDGTQEARDRVKDIMLSLGYEIEILNDGQVDSYVKPNDVTIEIHFEFMDEIHPHYEDFIVDWDSLLPTDRDSFYKMTVGDLYYYNIGHFIKNMSTRGNGIKPVVDAYVLWINMDDEQKSKTNKKLEKAGLKKISDILLQISEIWFDGKTDDGSTKNIQEYLMRNTVYGYERNREILNVLRTDRENLKTGLFNKYLKRFFPPADELYSRFSIKHRIFLLLPFLWIARIVLLPFKSRESKDKIRTEIKATSSVTQRDVDFFKAVYNDFGIEY